jgi:vacuolar iron transporter family protein
MKLSDLTKFSDLVRDFVFGMEDGLVSNLGLVLGVYVGGGDTFTIVLAGLASMFAGAFSMSAGSYLSAKSQREVYENEIKVTKEFFKSNPKKCFEEMKKSLMEEGLDKSEVDMIFKKPKHRHPEFVCNYMVQKRVGISKDKLEIPFRNAFTMFLSFLVGSLFPIAPFFFFSSFMAATMAVILTILALFFVGWSKTYYTKRNWFKSGLEIVLFGLGAAVIGYLVGWIVSSLA